MHFTSERRPKLRSPKPSPPTCADKRGAVLTLKPPGTSNYWFREPMATVTSAAAF